MSKLEKIFVNLSARIRNIKTFEHLFSQIDLSNVNKVLEVGCGVGVLSSYLVEKYEWEVTGIDLDPKQIKKAKNNHRENKYLKFLEADATKLPFEDNEFDLVLSSDTLHHIVSDWDKALSKISLVLSSNGYYVLNDLTFPNFSFFKKWSLSVDYITNYLKRNNFEIIYEKKPKISTFGNRFNIIHQKYPTIMSNYFAGFCTQNFFQKFCLSGRTTQDKREIKDFPKLALATSQTLRPVICHRFLEVKNYEKK